MYTSFLIGLVLCGFIGFALSIRLCYLELTNPVFSKPERYMIIICAGIILVWTESAVILATRI